MLLANEAAPSVGVSMGVEGCVGMSKALQALEDFKSFSWQRNDNVYKHSTGYLVAPGKSILRGGNRGLLA